MKRPLFSIFSRPSTAPKSFGSFGTKPVTSFGVNKPPTTFGEDRAAKMEKRLQTSIKERQTLARAEAATVDPLQSHVKDRGNVVAARIDQLHRELSEENN